MRTGGGNAVSPVISARAVSSMPTIRGQLAIGAGINAVARIHWITLGENGACSEQLTQYIGNTKG